MSATTPQPDPQIFEPFTTPVALPDGLTGSLVASYRSAQHGEDLWIAETNTGRGLVWIATSREHPSSQDARPCTSAPTTGSDRCPGTHVGIDYGGAYTADVDGAGPAAGRRDTTGERLDINIDMSVDIAGALQSACILIDYRLGSNQIVRLASFHQEGDHLVVDEMGDAGVDVATHTMSTVTDIAAEAFERTAQAFGQAAPTGDNTAQA